MCIRDRRTAGQARDERRETSNELRVTSEEKDKAAQPRHLKSDATAAGFSELSVRAGDVVVEVDPRYFRPTEVEALLGDASKARKYLGWEPRISFDEMVSQMVKSDLEGAQRDQLCKESGFRILNYSDE